MHVIIMDSSPKARWFITQDGQDTVRQHSFARWWYIDTRIGMAHWLEDNEWILN